MRRIVTCTIRLKYTRFSPKWAQISTSNKKSHPVSRSRKSHFGDSFLAGFKIMYFAMILCICLNPKGWCIGTPYHPFGTPWKIQAYIYICSRFRVPPPPPPAMVMVITHQPPSPLWNGWVLGRGGGHPTRTNRNATGRIRWRKLVSSKRSMYVEISYK